MLLPILNSKNGYVDLSISWNDRLLDYLSKKELPPENLPLSLNIMEFSDSGRWLHSYKIDFQSLFEVDIITYESIYKILKWYERKVHHYKALTNQEFLTMTLLMKLKCFGFLTKHHKDFLYYFDIVSENDQLKIVKIKENPYARKLE